MKEKPDGDLAKFLEEDIPEEVMGKLRSTYRSRSSSQVCPDHETVIAYGLGELSPAEKTLVHSHLLECKECLEIVLDLRSAWVEARGQQQEVQKKAPLSVKARFGLSELIGSVTELLSRFLSFPKLVPIVITASVVLAVLSIGVYQHLTAPIGIQLELIARSSDGLLTRGPLVAQEILVPSEGVLKSGDRFRIAFEINRDAYVYVFFQDNAGKITTLFSGKVHGDKRHNLPTEHDWFTLDETKGREEIHIMTAKHPIVNLDDVVQQLAREGISSLQKAYPQSYFRSFSFKHE